MKKAIIIGVILILAGVVTWLIIDKMNRPAADPPVDPKDTITYYYGYDTINNIIIDYVNEDGFRREDIGRLIRYLQVKKDSAGRYIPTKVVRFTPEILVSENPDVYIPVDSTRFRNAY